MVVTIGGLALILAAVLLAFLAGWALGWQLRGRTASVLAAQSEASLVALEPVRASLGQLDSAVREVGRAEAASRAALSEQMRLMVETSHRTTMGLERETRRLVGALSRSEVRGRWGEMQLRRLLETSGLVRGVHFEEQLSVRAEPGILRPDVLVRIGGGHSIVVDSKVSLAAFLQAEASDPGPEQEAALAAHTQAVAAHIDRLAAKAYWRQFEATPDFVVMFLPAEALLAEALARDPALLEEAFTRDVVLATPTTMQALLRTVGFLGRQESLAQDAARIRVLGRELHDRLESLVGHLDRMGSALGTAVTAYNRTIGSLDSRVLVTARKFSELTGEQPPRTPRLVETMPRSPASASPADAVASPRPGASAAPSADPSSATSAGQVTAPSHAAITSPLADLVPGRSGLPEGGLTWDDAGAAGHTRAVADIWAVTGDPRLAEEDLADLRQPRARAGRDAAADRTTVSPSASATLPSGAAATG